MQSLPTRRIVQSWRRRTGSYYRDPRSYWELRHREYQGALTGPGCIVLDEEANRLDYEVKSTCVTVVLARERAAGAQRILDAGCGTGVFTAQLRALGFTDVAGVDFSPTAAAAAQEAAPGCHISIAALHEITASCPYDVVMCIDVLFHVVDDETWVRTVRNLGALTSPGGALVIQDSLTDGGAHTSAQHVRFRSLADYRTQLSGCELEAHVAYELPVERIRKDLMVFRRLTP